MRRLYVPALLSIALGAGAANAHAAAGKWLPPETIATDHAVNPQTAIDRDGGAFVLFARSEPPVDEVRSTERPPGGDFGPLTVLPWLRSGGVGLGGVASTYDAAGRLVLSWRNDTELSPSPLYYAVREPGVTKWRTEALVKAEQRPAQSGLAADGEGTVYVVWHEWHDINQSCCAGPFVATMKDGMKFGKPRTIAQRAENGGLFQLDVSPSGAAVVAWADLSGFMASVQPSGGEFGRPEKVPGASAGVVSSAPEVSIDNAGAVLFAIKSVESRGAMQQPRTHIVVTIRRPDGGFRDPETISISDETTEPMIAAGPRGEAVIAWTEPDGENFNRFISVRGEDGSFSKPTLVGTGEGFPIEPQVGMDAAGNAIATWAVRDGSDTWRVYAAHRPPLGEFGEPVQISDAMTVPERWYPDPRLAVGGPGNAIVTWLDTIAGDESRPRVDAAVFDVAPPRIPDFEVEEARRIAFQWRVSEESDVTIKLRREGQVVRELSARATAGDNSAQTRRRGLPAGRYKAVLRAKDRLGHRSKPRRTRFTLGAG